MKTFLKFSQQLKETFKLDLEFHDTLNPKLWNGDSLKPEVRKDLLKFIEAFRVFALVPENLVLDIVMTGGNANYNYNSKSDIDCHLVIDRNKFLGPKNRAIADEYFQVKKSYWLQTHTVTAYGYDLEPYVQDLTQTPHEGQGVFSLKNNKWVQHPSQDEFDINQDETYVIKKVEFYIKHIKQLIKSGADVAAFDPIVNKFTTETRTTALGRGGEFAPDNLIFKELRNSGVLDEMKEYIRQKTDDELSLK